MDIGALELPEVQKAEILRLEPGDIVIVTLARPVDVETAQYLKATLEPHFPNNRVLVVSDMTVSVIKANPV